jgi:uncharacterized protein (TIGR02145 family)
VRKLLLTTATVAAAIGLAGCWNGDPNTLIDKRDGQKYRIVTIGGDRWMAQNLNYKTDSSWCYENADSNCVKYGRLYDWNTAKNVCPKGWILPDTADWNRLIRLDGGWEIEGKQLKSKSGWIVDMDEDGNGTDDFGFSALPGGGRDSEDDSFRGGGYNGDWWTATESDSGNACFLSLYNGSDDLDGGNYRKSDGHSVRCVAHNKKNAPATRSPTTDERCIDSVTHITDTASPTAAGTLTDCRDGQTYRTVKMPDGKTWMAQNMNYKTPNRSWCYNDSISYCDKYGRLYTWYAAMRVCPDKYHLPSSQEWDDLMEFIGCRWPDSTVRLFSWDSAGNKWNPITGWSNSCGEKLKSKNGWNDYCGRNGDESCKSGNGTDEYGFSALPGGERGFSDDKFRIVGDAGRWWTASEGNYGVYYMGMSNTIDEVYEIFDTQHRGVSVRCVADSP